MEVQLLHEGLGEGNDFVGLQIHGEVPGVEDVDFGAGIILLVGFSAGDCEGGVVAAPYDKEGRLMVAEPLLPFGVGFDVVLVVVEEVELDIRLAGLVEEIVFIGPEVGVVERGVG